MELSIKLDVSDWYKFQSYLEKELPKIAKAQKYGYWLNLFLWVLIAIFFMVIFQNIELIHWPTAIGVAVFFIFIAITFVSYINRLKKAFSPSESGTFVGQHDFVFSDTGIESNGNGYQAKHDWSVVKRIERSDGLILIFLDSAYAYIFPESKLENAEYFYRYVCEKFNQI